MVDRAPDGAIQATKPLRYQYEGNWKLQNENYADNYHPAILHQSTFEVGREIMVQKYRNRAAARHQYDRSFGYGHGATEYHNVRLVRRLRRPGLPGHAGRPPRPRRGTAHRGDRHPRDDLPEPAATQPHEPLPCHQAARRGPDGDPELPL